MRRSTARYGEREEAVYIHDLCGWPKDRSNDLPTEPDRGLGRYRRRLPDPGTLLDRPKRCTLCSAGGTVNGIDPSRISPEIDAAGKNGIPDTRIRNLLEQQRMTAIRCCFCMDYEMNKEEGMQ